jgi:cytochrome P450
MLKIHETYGPTVRISPNQLAIDGSIGWSEVFARHSNVPEFEKTPTFYGPRNGIGILPARHEDHQRQRRLMAYAFSAAALTEQESYLKYYIDLLMKRLGERMLAGAPVDMTRWYNYLTFDIIGELAFADPFNCLQKSDYHPLVAMIFSGIRGNAHTSFFEQYPFLRPLVNFMATKDDMEKRRQYYAMARAKTEKRIALGAETRKDFMAYILRNNKDGTGMAHEEILANARTLIGAGSHTTASALAGLTFYLIKCPEVYGRLAEEIRSTFSSEDDISMKSTAALLFLHACLEEALRIYPPLAETPPRVSPGAFVNGQYIPKGVEFFSSSGL